METPPFLVIRILLSCSCILYSQSQYFWQQVKAREHLIRFCRLQQGFPNALWDTCYNIVCLNPLDSLQRLLGLWWIMLLLGSQCASGNNEGCQLGRWVRHDIPHLNPFGLLVRTNSEGLACIVRSGSGPPHSGPEVIKCSCVREYSVCSVSCQKVETSHFYQENILVGVSFLMFGG